jgi:serine/threonine protein kinase/tetratricopeptide (TPR) repeat protein
MIGKTISHYKIIEKLGGGGMGVVYKAEDTRLDRFVALKFLSPHLSQAEEEKQRFIHEAKAASALDHPNICTIHEINETDDGRLFIVMAFYEGETIKQKLAHGPLAIAEAIDVTVQVARGLIAAHEKGIIHRDIKPANIILTDNSVVKIVDFGLVKLTDQTRLTQTGVALGTISYMSPEQIKGTEVDHRSDIWSLGVVLYEMLTIHPPFTADFAQAVFYSIINEEPDFTRLTETNVPDFLQHAIRKSLQKEPGQRFQSCEEIITELTSQKWEKEDFHYRVMRTKFKNIYTGSVWSRVVATLVIAGFILTMLLIWALPRDSLSLNPTDHVVVAAFENHTANPVFDHSVEEAIKVSLRQSASFNLLSPYRIFDALKRMQLPSDHPLNTETALLLAQREGGHAVVTGDISKLGSKYILSCRVVDAKTGETVRLVRREADRIEDVLRAMDGLCEDIRESLGESFAEISDNSMPLEKVTTSSLGALELYSHGNKLQGMGKYREAAVLIQEAVEKDSLFTIAISALSYIYRKIGNDSFALHYHYKVLPLIDRVTDRERYLIMATYYGPSFEMDFQKAFKNLQQYVILYPNDSEGFAYMAHLAMFSGDLKTALEANEKALQLDSTFKGTIYNNTGFARALAGNANESIYFFKMSKAIRPEYFTIDTYLGQAYLIKQEPDSAEQVLKSVLEVGNPRLKLRAHMQLASLYYLQGRLEASRKECQLAIELCKETNQPADQAYFHYLQAQLAIEQGDGMTFRTEIELTERLCDSPFFEFALVGISYARNGYLKDARRIKSKIERATSLDPYFLKRKNDFIHIIQSEIYLATGEEAEAQKEFEAVQKKEVNL